MKLDHYFQMDFMDAPSDKKHPAYVENIDFIKVFKLLMHSVSKSPFTGITPFSELWFLHWLYDFVIENELPIFETLDKIELEENSICICCKDYTNDFETMMLIDYTWATSLDTHVCIDISYEHEVSSRYREEFSITDIEEGNTESILEILKKFGKLETSNV